MRTPELVAVANEGKPFDEEGIRAVTSLGVSPKDATITIGNKGVGFKAVFEVTDAPEIYSSRSDNLTGSFRDPGGSWFRLHQDPLAQPNVKVQLETIAAELLRERPDDAAAITARTGRIPLEAVVEAISLSAPFRYPIALHAERLARRIAELSLPESVRAAQTLVVLPLLRGPDGDIDAQAAGVVEEAFGELLRQGPAIVLFLDGVRKIIVDDRIAGTRHVLRRGEAMTTEVLARGSDYVEIVTEYQRHSSGALVREEQSWLLARRTIGQETHGDTGRAHAESTSLNEAAKKLPGKNWTEVKTTAVSVALPIPEDDSIGHSLGTDGLLCIGLPTLMPTGTPLWLDARFHGNISRTEVYWNQPYNQLLLDEATALVGDLISRIKADPTTARRRLVALALEPAGGIAPTFFGKRLYASDGLAAGTVILAADTGGFLAAADLALPAGEDRSQFELLVEGAREAAARGFVLPEAALLARGRAVLEKLPGYRPPPPHADGRFLQRPPGGLSLLELAARRHRLDGPWFWEPFLTWLLDRYAVEQLADQRLLPVGRDALAAPEARIFYRPWTPTTAAPPDAESAGREEEEEEEEDIGTLPDEVRDALAFLDERSVRIREGGRKRRTTLGTRLAPAKGTGLIRAPRRTELINDVVVPRLREIAERVDDQSDRLGIALLQQALTWSSLIKPGTPEDAAIRRDEVLVPVVPRPGCGRMVQWALPGQAYFGRGWLDGREAELLLAVHGDRPGVSLVPWSTLQGLVGASASLADRDWWRPQLAALGVLDRPRPLSRKRINAFQLRWGALHRSTNVEPPWPGMDALWSRYLDAVAQTPRSFGYAGGEYHLQDVAWVDGLERPENRAAVFELMLAHPEVYESFLTSEVVRDSLRERFVVPSLWSWALASQNWAVIPLVKGYGTPSESWLLDSDQRRDHARFRLLPAVHQRFEPARRLLTSVGVCVLSDAPPGRLVEALHDLAALLPLDGADERSARSLAADLYGRLANCTEEGAAYPDALRDLRQRPIPVLRGGDLVAADPSVIPVLYVDDDPVRRAFLGDPADIFFVPSRNDTPEFRLTKVLQHALAPGHVVLTSRAEVDTGFVPMEGGSDELLLDFLEHTFPRVTVDLAGC